MDQGQPDQTVAQVPVKVGYQDDEIATITDGITGNDTVVLSGQSRLVPGVKVTVSDARS